MDHSKLAFPIEGLDDLISLRHSNPHQILGVHLTPRGVVTRVLRPDLSGLFLLRSGFSPQPFIQIDPIGFFEVLIADETEIFSYELELHPIGGKISRIHDPYSFLPTLGELDLHLFSQGRHHRLYDKLGSHVLEWRGVSGITFTVWAPNVASISVVGDFNGWDGRFHMMRCLGTSGIWELFIPGIKSGVFYKYEIRTLDSELIHKSDPYAQEMEMPPGTASVVHHSTYKFEDHQWMEARKSQNILRRPISIYEVHLGSWRRVPEEGNRPLRYREVAPLLVDYVLDLGFTHVEFLPLMEHPFGGSWGYQVSSYYAPTSRYGAPDDFRFLIDYLHQKGIGVILDWVPAHFPKDLFALGRFNGTALYEHLDARQGEHPDWGTFIFNYGRNEVKNFLLANALFWLSEYHVDGLRLDAVASMLYLDYSRKEGEWVANQQGGRENLEAIDFLKELNEVAHAEHPGILMMAEESTSWPGVSRPTYTGGLGFGYKWNMGWMHDTLVYFGKDPIYRRYHQNLLTFGFLYAWTENFILPFSHDEVVHGKGSLLTKMPGDRWQKFANLRTLFAYMWSYPGKKLTFMGCEFGQWNEWNHRQSLDWHVLWGEEHSGLQRLIRDMNRIYKGEPALWDADGEPSGFQWIDFNDVDANVIAFIRTASNQERQLISICNFSPTVRQNYRLGLPRRGWYSEILNTDAACYGGSNVGNRGGIWAEEIPWQGQPFSANFHLPPLAVMWFEVPK
ncbi:MAG: 1,4-alpha-glucan branching protein GlgB [Chlamydiae bacterium]|nr:1,4-alpha-glucan branching protein GlgB [Chlamydiota bacterium]MBI3278163.1 1,4-alpha-glucan branching protein GlgB [Chlamydiota bacterium]